MRQTLQDRRAKRFFYLKNKKPSLTNWAWLSMVFYLTVIFLSSALAERCKINFGKFWVEVIWLPESWAGRGGRSLGSTCAPEEEGVGILLSALGVAGGSHGLCVSAPRWERQCSLGRVVWNRAACEHGPPSLSCPWRLVFQHSPFQGPGRGYSQELNHKPNQRLNTTYNEIHETAFTSLLSLVPRYWLAVREQTGALGSPGVVCPVSEAGRLILEALFSCCWMTPGPHLYKRQEPWYILNLWEDLLASSWHKAVFLALTVSGTRSDSLLNWRYLWEHPFWPPQLAWSFLCLFVKWKWVCAS